MTGARSFSFQVSCVLLPLVLLLAGGLCGQTHAPSPETCRVVTSICTRLENIINGYKETMAENRLRRNSWSEAERHYSEMSWLYSDFNYLMRVDFAFSSSTPYKDHITFVCALLLSYEFALDQVQLDLSLHPEINNIHIEKSTEISKQLELLLNEIRREAKRVNIPVNREDIDYFLTNSYIAQSVNDYRKDRHFLTLLEIMNGMVYIKDMFSAC